MVIGSTTHEATDRAPHLSCGVGYWVSGVVSAVLTLVVVALAYPALVAALSVVPLLSTTAVVFAALLVWFPLWFVVDASTRRVVART